MCAYVMYKNKCEYKDYFIIITLSDPSLYQWRHPTHIAFLGMKATVSLTGDLPLYVHIYEELFSKT